MPDPKGRNTKKLRELVLARFERGYTRAEIVRDLGRNEEFRLFGIKKLHGPNELRPWVNWALCSKWEAIETGFPPNSYKHERFVEKDVVLESEKLESREDRVTFLRDHCPDIRKRHEERERTEARERKRAEERERKRAEFNDDWDW